MADPQSELTPSQKYAPFQYPDHMKRLHDLTKMAKSGSQLSLSAACEFETALVEQMRVLNDIKARAESDRVHRRIARITELREEKTLACVSNIDLMARLVAKSVDDANMSNRLQRLATHLGELAHDTMYLRHPFADTMLQKYAQTRAEMGEMRANEDLELYSQCAMRQARMLDKMTESLLDMLHPGWADGEGEGSAC